MSNSIDDIIKGTGLIKKANSVDILESNTKKVKNQETKKSNYKKHKNSYKKNQGKNTNTNTFNNTIQAKSKDVSNTNGKVVGNAKKLGSTFSQTKPVINKNSIGLKTMQLNDKRQEKKQQNNKQQNTKSKVNKKIEQNQSIKSFQNNANIKGETNNSQVSYMQRPVQVISGAKVKIIPLGGLDQIGMNITAIEYEDEILVVDCGLAFPNEDQLGIDVVLPDVTYLKDNIQKVKGIVITHGHEDHIGALPYLLNDLKVPVYATRIPIALIEKKLEEHTLTYKPDLNVVKFGDVVDLGKIKVEYIKTNHSIVDAAALAIYTPAGVIVHTGDFKVDYTPVFGDSIDLQRFAEIGKEGVLAMLSDSTNAIKPGFTMSEKTVGRTLDLLFQEHEKQRIIIATFASNVDRVQQVINTSAKYNRKVCVEGRSMVDIISVASELGYINIPKNTLYETDQINNFSDDKTVIITTGSQGESMAALSRMANGTHKKIKIKENDLVILSSTPIPGNEKAVGRVINELSQKHAEVIFQDTHVSGHACEEELKLLYTLVSPKYAIPVHGEYRHRKAAVGIARSVGVEKENALLVENGDIVELSEKEIKITGKVQTGQVLVDGLGVGDVGNRVLRDRQNLSQNGIIIIVLVLERGTGHLIAGPDLVSRGFVYVKESEELLKQVRCVVLDSFMKCESHNVSDWVKLKDTIKKDLEDFLRKAIKREPVILPIITEV